MLRSEQPVRSVPTVERRGLLHRRARFIVAFTISYNLLEAVVAIWAGTAASSAALIGFGLDSVVEVLSALAAYIIVDSILTLTGAQQVEHSPLVMPALAWFEFRTGRELSSKSVQADAKQLLLCIYLSGTVLIGLLLNTLFGWMWADSVAALIVAGLAIREGIEAWRGEVESPFDVLSGDDGH